MGSGGGGCVGRCGEGMRRGRGLLLLLLLPMPVPGVPGGCPPPAGSCLQVQRRPFTRALTWPALACPALQLLVPWQRCSSAATSYTAAWRGSSSARRSLLSWRGVCEDCQAQLLLRGCPEGPTCCRARQARALTPAVCCFAFINYKYICFQRVKQLRAVLIALLSVQQGTHMTQRTGTFLWSLPETTGHRPWQLTVLWGFLGEEAVCVAVAASPRFLLAFARLKSFRAAGCSPFLLLSRLLTDTARW